MNPGERRGIGEQRKLDTALRTLFDERIRFNRLLGFRVTTMDERGVGIDFSMRRDLIGHCSHDRLHGGVISSVLDATGGLAVVWSIAEFHAHESTAQVLGRFEHLGTIDLRVDYLRPGLGDEFHCHAEVVRLGRRVAVVRMQLASEAQGLIATGNANYIVS